MTTTHGSEPCGLGRRGVSIAIDAAVWLAAFFVATFAVGAATGQVQTTASGLDVSLEGTNGMVAFLLWLGLALGYHTVLEWRFGRTLGKALVGIRVTGIDRSSPSLGASLTRNVLRLVDVLPVLYLVGIVLVVSSERSQRLGDRAGGTVVVGT